MSITGSEQWMYSSGREFYDFPIEQSLRFNRADSTYLNRTASSPTLGTKATWSFWIKKCDVVSDTSGSYRTVFYCGTPNVDGFRIGFARYSGNNHVLHISQDNGSSSAYIFMRTEAALRDTSAWYNFVIRYDSTDATAADRIKVYINGELASIQSSPRTNPPLNHIPKWQVSGTTLKIGKGRDDDNEHYDMYLADVNFIDGQALAPTSFGELKSGIWIPKDTADLTFGTNGFRLQFGDTTEASGFNALTYTGNQSNLSVNGCGFSPDLVWIKSRTNAYNHELYDTVRGVQKALQSSTTNAETTETQGLLSFDSDGFSVGSRININEANDQHVGWTWDAGSGSAASNTDGSITSTVKANTDYGFSITSYTGNATAGATVGHGLGVAPDMIIVKSRDNFRDWRVYHSSLGSAYTLDLNTTNAVAGPSTAYWNSTDPTSSVFSIGSVTTVNGSGEDYIAYCFAEKTGYSKIGTYTGTGAAGNSITLGFKPAFLLIKETGNANSWELFDNTRNTSSPFDKRLFPNTNAAEATTTSLSYSDTGFETLNGNTGINRSGGTYIYMAFADTRNAAFWKDTSGEGNDWQPNNLVFSDVVPDGTNNFAVLAPVNNPTDNYSEGRLKFQGLTSATSPYSTSVLGTFGVSSGKWYYEARANTRSNGVTIGFAREGLMPADGSIPTYKVFGFNIFDNVVTTNNSNTNDFTVTGASGDILGLAIDIDNGTASAYINGTLKGSVTGLNTSGYQNLPYATLGWASGGQTMTMNFGQDSTFAGNEAAGGNADENGYGDFAYAPPSGYLSLCSANLPSGAIDTVADETPEDYFNTVLWTGNGTSQSITGVGFQSDLVWTKKRSSTSSHYFVDAVRGSDKVLFGNSTDAEVTTSNVISSFDSDGFSIGSDGGINASGQTFVGWNWKANGAGVSNTDGSIASTVSVSETSQGVGWFSVVGFTTQSGGYTVGHGLGQKPSLIITKNRDTAGGAWYTFTDIIDGSVDYLALNQTSAKLNDPFGLANPTSSVFSLDDDYIFGSGDCIAYCFANAEGLCKVGSYVGNGSTDGTYVHLGFRPSFVMWKRTDTTSDWFMMDVKRDIDNPTDHKLEANTSGAEVVNSAYYTDYLSNGFKLRNNNAQLNASGGNYIYLAIASQPFKYANAR